MSIETSISKLRQAAQAAKTPQQRAAALDLLLAAAGRGSPDEGEIRCLAGRLYRDDGDIERALRAFGEGEAADEKADVKAPAWTSAEHARLLLKAGRPGDAASRARRGLASGRSSPALLAALGQALLASRAPMAETEPALRAAILANPADRLLVESWFDRLRGEASADAAARWLEALQEESPTLLRGVLTVLAGAGGREAVRTRLAARLDALSRQEPFAQCARVWQAAIEDRAPQDADRAVVAGDTQNAELFCRFLMPKPDQAPLFGSETAEARLQAIGIRIEPFRDFVRELKTIRDPAWRAVVEGAPIAGESARLFMRGSEAEGAFSGRIVETGTLAVADPFSGASVEPFDSCVMFGRTAYGFRGRELFYLICGQAWNGVLGLYVPRYNLSIPFESRGTALMADLIANTLATLLVRFARHRPALPVPVPPGGRRRIVLAVPGTENFAHHVWNFYSAIERLVAAGQVRHLSKVLFSGTEFFGPLDELFPELAEVGVERPPKSNVVDPYPFDPSGLVLRAGGFLVAESLTRRIVEAMRRRPRLALAVPEPDDVPQAARVPVFWFGLRLRDKAWTGQEEGIARIIRILAQRHPDALFLLDGFSYPVGIDLISAEWRDVIAALKAMAGRIRTASGSPERVIDMVGNSLRESVLWAQVTDAYLAPYGTSQHKVGWFSKARGLAYLPAGTLTRERAERSPACSVCAYSVPPEFLFAEPASMGERRGANRGREGFSNVSLDPEPLAERLNALLVSPARPV